LKVAAVRFVYQYFDRNEMYDVPFDRSLPKRQPIEDPKFHVPVFVVMGEKDYVFKFPGIEAVLKDGVMAKFAPDLKVAYIPEGSHFVQEQFPDMVNELLLRFLKDHPVA
jgi:pimeloyl-ACP methyl ester carboxylesterase